MDKLKLKPLGAFLLVGGLVLLLYTFRMDGPPWQAHRSVQGEVLERYTSPSRNVAEPDLILRIRVWQGDKPRVLERKVREETWNAHPQRSQVTLTLQGEEWQKANVQGDSREHWISWIKIVGGALGAILGVVVLAYDRWWK